MATTVAREQVKGAVRETYGRIATEERSAGCCGSTGCCGPGAQASCRTRSATPMRNAAVLREGADLGLGCRNPQAIRFKHSHGRTERRCDLDVWGSLDGSRGSISLGQSDVPPRCRKTDG